LFFNCPFTKQVWDAVSHKSQLTWQSQSLANLVSLLSSIKRKDLKSTLIKLTFTVTLYHIWIERNIRKFQNTQLSVTTLVHKICTEIRCRLLSLHKIPPGAVSLFEAWNITDNSN
jgi:hypothetical protein